MWEPLRATSIWCTMRPFWTVWDNFTMRGLLWAVVISTDGPGARRLRHHLRSAVRLTRRDRRQDGGAVGPSPSAGLGGGSVRGETRRRSGAARGKGPTVEPLQQSCPSGMLRARVWVEQRSGGSRSQQGCLKRRRLQRPTRDLQRPGGGGQGWSAASRRRGASLGCRIEGGDAGGEDGEMGGEGPDCVGLCGHVQYQIRWDIRCATWNDQRYIKHCVCSQTMIRECWGQSRWIPPRLKQATPVWRPKKKNVERMFVASLQNLLLQVWLSLTWP